MFTELLHGYRHGWAIENSPITISDQILITRRLCPESGIVNMTEEKLAGYCSIEGNISKIELLSFWESADVPFASKCLATLWWGKPNHLLYNKVYTVSNLQKLQKSEMEARFQELEDMTEINDFKRGLESLYYSFLPQGECHLKGVGPSFITKFFHFYFAANKPKSAPDYLPVIADEIMRCAVFAEMLDSREDVDHVFYSNRKGVPLRSYVAYADKFNEYASSCQLPPFLLEDIVFNSSRGIGKAYVDGYNGRLCLPHWIAGRYNEQENMATVFNNLNGETYLFEGLTARLWREILGYEYEKVFCIDDLCSSIGCSRFDLMSFMNDFVTKSLIINH